MSAFPSHGAVPSPRQRTAAPSPRRRRSTAVRSELPVGPVTREPVGLPVTGAVMDLVVPARDAQRELEPFVRRLDGYLTCYFPYAYRLSVVDLASSDRTLAVAERLAREMPGVRAVHQGSDNPVTALRAAWAESTAPVVAVTRIAPGMDLAVLAPLVVPLISGHSDLAFGTDAVRDPRFARTVAQRSVARFAHRRPPAARAVRRRRASAGVVAVRADAVMRVLPLLREEAGTFEAQLLALAIRSDMRVFGMPVERALT